MTPAQRIARIESECSGVWGQSGITDWERQRLNDWKALQRLSEKQEAILRQIEQKAFGEGDE